LLKLYNEVSLAGNEQEQLHLGNSAAAVKWGLYLYDFASKLISQNIFVCADPDPGISALGP
jgi:hypothetical protein